LSKTRPQCQSAPDAEHAVNLIINILFKAHSTSKIRNSQDSSSSYYCQTIIVNKSTLLNLKRPLYIAKNTYLLI